jgi:L-ribulose-5-phosphate 4-epimerase
VPSAAAARYSQLRSRAYNANVEIARVGLVALTFGNASAVDRDAGVIAIKPSGTSYDLLRDAEMVVIDLETGAVVDGDTRPSSDTPTHLVLYRAFAEIGAIVHTHSPFATAWAQACRDLPCLGTTHADHFDGPVLVTRQLTSAETANDYELRTGDVIVETFAAARLDPLTRPAVLVASHGAFAWGADVDDAVENAVALELVAASASRTEQLSPLVEEINDGLRRRHFLRKHGPAAYYGQPR